MSSNQTSNQTSNANTANLTTLPQAAKAQTAKEVIAENIQLLIAQLEAGHSEGLTAYLTAMGRFHNYSFGNILEIARQKPDATRVAGMYAWNQLGRRVKKGEKGIRILAPMIGTRKRKDTEPSQDPAVTHKPVLVGFRSAYVFDVSQTEGAELPELSSKVTGTVGEYRERLIDFLAAQGIALEFKESIAPASGHELRRTHRHPARTAASRGVQHLGPRARARDAPQSRAPYRNHQDRTRDRGRSSGLCGVANHRPECRTRLRRLHPPVPRQRRPSRRIA